MAHEHLTNIEMRQIAEHHVAASVVARHDAFLARLRVYENALINSITDQETISKRRHDLLAQFNDTNDRLGVFERKYLVDCYPSNHEPAMGTPINEESKP